MKVLIISVGTGARPSEEAIESLSSAISYSIRNSNPDKVLFVVSKQSVQKTLPRVLRTVAVPHDVIQVEDPDNINKIYEDLSPKFAAIRDNFTHITVDFTSGTKAMSAALAILGSLYEADTLAYVTGKRAGGIVVKGTEQVLSLRPYPVVVERTLRQAVALFNSCRFEGCHIILQDLASRIPDPGLSSQLTPLQNATLAYSAWERFDHQAAFSSLKEVKFSQFDQNKAFLGKLLSGSQPEREPYFIADLISNAKRRGEVEHKYDDAVARLYRTIELVAQYRLKKYGVADTGKVPRDKIPPELIAQWKVVPATAKLGLYQDYQLLAAKGDDLAQAFLQDKRLQDLLQKRNDSILAHGLQPVTREDYEQLRDSALSYGKAAVAAIDNLISQSTFARWPE